MREGDKLTVTDGQGFSMNAYLWKRTRNIVSLSIQQPNKIAKTEIFIYTQPLLPPSRWNETNGLLKKLLK